MSYWRCMLADMAEAGGDDIQISSLPGWGITRVTREGRDTLRHHGLIKPVGSRRHSITDKGWRLLSGAADLVEPKHSGKRGHLPRSYALVVRGATVPDIVIEDLLTECGLQPGAAISPDIIRAYSARLAAVVRASA